MKVILIILIIVITAVFIYMVLASNNSDSAASEYLYNDIQNPLIKQRADPWVYLHTDGYYYFTATVPEYDRIELRRSETVKGLANALPEIIWTKHETGEMGSHIWAPEIHFINGAWYIYFAAGRAEAVWEIRMYVLENKGENPLLGTWVEKGRIETFDKTFSLDATVFEHNNVNYLVWAQKDIMISGNTNLYIAELENPWTIKGRSVMLSKPEYQWETYGYWVNEGPAVLIKNSMVFLTYSASATDHHYCMGILTASADSNLLDPESWEKSTEPVFSSSDKAGIYGPGHSCFIKAPDGETDLLVYHARNYKEIAGDPLGDPNRHTRVQKILWNEDGTPDFGIPVPE